MNYFLLILLENKLARLDSDTKKDIPHSEAYLRFSLRSFVQSNCPLHRLDLCLQMCKTLTLWDSGKENENYAQKNFVLIWSAGPLNVILTLQCLTWANGIANVKSSTWKTMKHNRKSNLWSFLKRNEVFSLKTPRLSTTGKFCQDRKRWNGFKRKSSA